MPVPSPIKVVEIITLDGGSFRSIIYIVSKTFRENFHEAGKYTNLLEARNMLALHTQVTN